MKFENRNKKLMHLEHFFGILKKKKMEWKKGVQKKGKIERKVLY